MGKKHYGFHYWTIGQRCRIGGLLQAYYIFHKDETQNNIIIVPGNEHPALYSNFFKTESPHWIVEEPSELTNGNVLECGFRFQRAQSIISCKVFKTPTNELVVRSSYPRRALTKGQYVVFYREDECLGSAASTYTGPSYYMLDRKVPDIPVKYNTYEDEIQSDEQVQCIAV